MGFDIMQETSYNLAQTSCKPIELLCQMINMHLNLPFRFVSNVLPPGGQELKGDEVHRIINFKNSLGIDDPDAAAMHMEVFFC